MFTDYKWKVEIHNCNNVYAFIKHLIYSWYIYCTCVCCYEQPFFFRANSGSRV